MDRLYRSACDPPNYVLKLCPKLSRSRGVLQVMTAPNGQDYSTADDSDLVILAHDDQAAFGELYERYVKKIYAYIYYRTGNQHDAEDLTSRVFHRALIHIDSYVERGVPFQAWLYRIA